MILYCLMSYLLRLLMIGHWLEPFHEDIEDGPEEKGKEGA